MRTPCLLLGLASLWICAGCGSGNGAVTAFIPTGGFSNSSLSGQYVYQIEGFDFGASANGVPYREAGVFTANASGAISSVTDDFSEGSTVQTTTSTGTYAISTDGTGSLSFNTALGTIHLAVTVVNSSKVYLVEGDTALTGRGTGTFTDNSPATSSFIYYIVDANNIRLLPANLGAIGLGRAEKQVGTPALSGSYAFASRGDTFNFLDGVNTAGRFTASAGSITAGALDSVQDGNVIATNLSFTGTYTQVASRALVSLSTTSNGNLVIWMVSPSRGFFLVNDPNTIQDGTLDLQTTSSFSNSTMNGQYALVRDGFDSAAKDRVGTLQWDGSGKLTLNAFVNAGGVINVPVLISGNYAVSGNGRAGGSLSGLSNNLVFYLISGTDAYVVQNDPGVQISGSMSKQ